MSNPLGLLVSDAGFALLQAGNATAANALLTTTQYVVPTTGTTVTADGSHTLLLDPAGTLATLTVALPASPVDKQQITISVSQIITALTITGTITGTLTTLGAGGFASFQWNAASGKWFRAG